jgi:transposase-like protein
VALEALKEDKTIAEIASKHGVHLMQVSQWKKELVDGAEAIFVDKRSRKNEAWDREALERKVGQQVIELDYLKKN